MVEDEATDYLALIGGSDLARNLRKATKGDDMSRKLSTAVYMELAKRLRKSVDRNFYAAMNRLKSASKQSTPASASNLIFKAADELGMNLPSGTF